MRLRVGYQQWLTDTAPYTFIYDGVPTVYDNMGSFDSVGRYNGMQDVVTANFQARSQNGEVIISPMFKWEYSMVHSPCRHKSEFYQAAPINKYSSYEDFPLAYATWGGSDQYIGSPTADEIFDPSDDNRNEAIAKAWADVDVSEIQALASIGELPETVRWISSLFRRSISLIKMFNRKRGLLTAVKLSVKAMSKREIATLMAEFWLEYRYAFRPLVFEMHQAISAMRKSINKNDRGTGRGYKKVLDTSISNYQFNFAYWSANASRNVKVTTHLRAGVLYQIEDDLHSLLAVWGIDQPLESIYELVPFSFIVDWFFNVGDVIAAWTDNTGLLPLGSWLTEEQLTTVDDKYYDCTITPPAGYTIHGSPHIVSTGYHHYEEKAKRRIVNPSLSLIPSVKFNLDLAKTLDLAAIARMLFLSGGRVKIGGTNVR